MNDSQKDSLRPHAVELEPILSVDGPFDVRDVRDKLPETKTVQMWLQELNLRDVIHHDGKQYTERGTVNQWAWNPKARQWLKEQANRINTLPCGCRSHIPSDIGADSDTGTCKHCGATHSKEVIKNSL